MAVKRLDIIGSSLPILADIGEGGDNADYRPVPESDKGNEGYTDRGLHGSYTPDSDPYRPTSEVQFFAGYGADEEDLRRGYKLADVNRDPAYDKANYEMRSTSPRVSTESAGNTDSMPSDFEFRARNQRSRGFLTRPRIPTER